MKILNLYAGIGGNRKLWGDEHEITAVENKKHVAKVYKKLFPKDKVVIGDAHKYLLKHYKEFDFIWSSPPCPSHSRLNYPAFAKGKVRFPDMKLYEEIIFLKWCFKGNWVVENVISYYDPLIKPKLLGRHYYWSNFFIDKIKQHINDDIANATINKLQEYHNIDLSKFKTENKRLMLRNAVNPKHGLHIFNCAFKTQQNSLCQYSKEVQK